MDTITDLPVIESAAASPASLQGRVLASREALAAFLPQWRLFVSDSTVGRNLFNDPDYVRARLEAEPGLTPLIVTIWNQDRLCAVAPFYLHQGRFALRCSVWRLATWPARFARLFGDDIQVAAEASPQACIAAAFQTLLNHHAEYDLVAFDALPMDHVLWNMVTGPSIRSSGWRWFHAEAQAELRHQILLPASHEAYMASLGSRTRQNLRRMARKLCQERQGRLLRITQPEQVPQFLDQVDQVFRETWQAKTFGYWPRNRPDQVAFFQELARLGFLRSYLLQDGDRPLAYDIAFQYRDVFHAYEIGFAQSAAELSPGTVLMHLFIEDLFRERTPRWVDFGSGNQQYKKSLCTHSHSVADILLIHNLWWRWLCYLQLNIFRFERIARASLTLANIDKIVRRLLKHRT